MAKPMLVTWPFVLLVLDYWPLRRVDWRPADGIERFAKAWLPLVREKLPLFGMVAASMVVTWFAQADVGPGERIVDVPLALRIANALVWYTQYIFLTFWPADLAVYYPFSPAGRADLADRGCRPDARRHHGTCASRCGDAALADRRMAVVRGNVHSRHRSCAGWDRSGDGGSLLLHSIHRTLRRAGLWSR